MIVNETINFSVPITESVLKKDNKFVIRGVAINAGVTRNQTIFIAEELQKAASTLKHKPLLKDHNNSIDSIVGKVTENVSYNPIGQNIMFEAVVIDGVTQEKINAGLINSVSIGAMVKEVEETFDESSGDKVFIGYSCKGIEFVELSLVAVPADPNAGFTHAVYQSIQNSSLVKLEKENSILKQKEEQEAIIMAEEISKLDAIKLERAKVEEEMAALQLEMLKVEKAKLEASLKQTVAPQVVEEKKDETKGEILVQEEAKDDYTFVKEDVVGFGIARDYSNNQSLKRLVRN